jgi:hypothetical protein
VNTGGLAAGADLKFPSSGHRSLTNMQKALESVKEEGGDHQHVPVALGISDLYSSGSVAAASATQAPLQRWPAVADVQALQRKAEAGSSGMVGGDQAQPTMYLLPAEALAGLQQLVQRIDTIQHDISELRSASTMQAK